MPCHPKIQSIYEIAYVCKQLRLFLATVETWRNMALPRFQTPLTRREGSGVATFYSVYLPLNSSHLNYWLSISIRNRKESCVATLHSMSSSLGESDVARPTIHGLWQAPHVGVQKSQLIPHTHTTTTHLPHSHSHPYPHKIINMHCIFAHIIRSFHLNQLFKY